ncbi:MAG: ABC transporter substrate-binding protein [Acidobacteria bacterium]|nr:ABC transporter substrate-binding protein [Acidobacteriota bacterium]
MRHPSIIPVLLLAFASCGGERAGAPNDAGSPLVIAWDNAPANLDPRIGNDISSGRISDLVHAGLIRVLPSGDYEGDLASSWTTPDDRTIVFTMRDGISFHDGRPVRASDVKFTYDSLMSEGFPSPKKSGYATVAAIEAPDAKTVVFHLKEPNGGIFDNLTVGIVPTGSDEKLFRTKPIGAGPYRLVENLPDESVVLEAFAGYHRGKPSIGRIEFRIIPDTTTRMLELERGSVGLAINSLPLDSVGKFETSPRVRVVSEPGSRWEYLAFNLGHPKLGNLLVRRAIAHAIDRERIVRDLLRSRAKLADTMFPVGHWARSETVARYPYDKREAKRLLDEAGFPDPDGDGPAMRFNLVYKTSLDMEANQRAEMVQQMLREVGIGMEIRSTEFAVFYDDIQKGNFELFALRRGGISDPDFYYTIFHSKSAPPNGQNRGRYANAEVDRLIEAGRATMDRTKRKAAYDGVQRIVSEELPYVSLYHLDNVAVVDRRIEGLKLHPSGFIDSLAKARWGEK